MVVQTRPMPTNNPYSAPESNLEPAVHAPRKMLWWKIFCWVFVLIQLSAAISMAADYEELTWQDPVDIFIYGFVCTGIYGFAYQKKILIPLAWRALIVITLLWDSIYLGTEFYDLLVTEDEGRVIFVIILIVFSPLLFLQYLALYKYAFQSAHLWQANTKRAASE